MSSVLQMTPYGYTTAALDLGRDMNRVYHGEEGAWKDAGLDILGMIPGVSKLGMKKIKPKTVIDKVKQSYNEFLQPAREGVNSAINVLKALDFIDDTLGANRTSDVKQEKRRKYSLGGNLYELGGDSYSYTKPLDNVIVDEYGNLLDPNVPSARGTVQLPEVIASTRDPRKAVPTANSLNSIESPTTQIRNTLYKRLAPLSDYDIINNFNGMMNGDFEYGAYKDPKFSREEGYPEKTDYATIGDIKTPLSIVDGIWAEYLQIPKENRKKFAGPTIQQSKYKPSFGGRSDVNYYALPLTKSARASVVNEGLGLPIGRNMVTTTLEDSGNTVYNLGQYTLGRGMDTKGDYISYYDVFDLNPFSDKYNGTDIPILNKLDDASFGIGKPVHIYDRIYLDDYYGMPNEYRGSSYLPELEVFKEKPYKIEATYRTVK